MTRHAQGCGCAFCQGLAKRVISSADWRREHQPHQLAANVGGDFAREPYAHPSGTWFWLRCVCGARHLSSQENEA